MNGFSYALFSLLPLSVGVAGYLLSRQGLFSEGGTALLRWGSALCFAVFLVLNFLGYQVWRREEHRLARLRESGQRVIAEITGLEQDRSVAVNHQNPYRLVCEWKDPRNGSTYRFVSARIFHDPTFALRDKRQISVFVDSRDFSNYDVDLSSVDIQP